MHTFHKARKRQFCLLAIITCVQIVCPALLQEYSLFSAELRPKLSEAGRIDSGQGLGPLSHRSQAIPDFTIEEVTAFNPLVTNSEVPVEVGDDKQKKPSEQGSNDNTGNTENELDDLVSYLIIFLLVVAGWRYTGLPVFHVVLRPKDERFDSPSGGMNH